MCGTQYIIHAHLLLFEFKDSNLDRYRIWIFMSVSSDMKLFRWICWVTMEDLYVYTSIKGAVLIAVSRERRDWSDLDTL